MAEPTFAPATPASFSNVPSKDDIASNRKLALALMGQATDASPVGHWTQALARTLQGGVGAWKAQQASQGEKSRQDALVQALAGSGTFGGLGEGDRAILSQNPEVLSSVAAKSIGNRLDPNAGLNRQLLEAKIQQARSGGEQPSNVREWKYYNGLSPEQQQQYLTMKRAEKYLDVGTGFVRPNPIDPANPTPVVQKDIAGRERAEAIGQAGGKAAADLPRIVDNANQTLQLIQKIRTHPGTEKNFGVQGYIPNMPGGKAADAYAMVEQLGGKAFLEAFNSLKGGGQITEVEGKKATDATVRMSKAQSHKAFTEALDDLESVIRTGVTRAQGAARGGVSPNSPAAGGWSVREIR
jgi:hypothetical protein